MTRASTCISRMGVAGGLLLLTFLPFAATAAAVQNLETFRYVRPIFRIWQDFTLAAGDEVRRVFVVLGSATIDGTVRGDVVVLLGDARLGSTAVVGGSVIVIAGNATAQPGASVRRDFVVVGGSAQAPAGFSPGGDHVVVGTPVLGERLRQVADWAMRGPLVGRIIVPGIPWVWPVVAVVFLVHLLFNHIFDGPVRAAAQMLTARPLGGLLMGLLLVVVTGPILALLAASVVGLLAVPFVIGALFIGWTVGKVGVTRWLGMSVVAQQDLESRWQSLRSFLVGFLILTAAYAVPILGLATWALVGVFGLGAAGLVFLERRRRERPPKTPQETPPAVASTTVTSAPPDGVPPTAEAQPEPMRFAEVVVSRPSPLTAVPPPEAGATAALPHAAFLDRAAAFALDCILVAIASQVLDPVFDDGWFLPLLLVYHVAFWTWKGTTLGGIICNVRVVRTDGGELRLVDAVVRGLTSLFSIAAVGIGCLWMLRDPNSQTWHDKVAGTYVVKVPKDWPLP